MLFHIESQRRVWGMVRGYDLLKGFFKVYTRGPEEYLPLREKLFASRSFDEALALVAEFRPGESAHKEST